MMKILFILFVLFIPIIALSQSNLVPNHSFEVFSGCPTQQGEIYLAIPWYSPTAGNPDYFNICSTNQNFSVPQNASGYEEAFDGKAYVGFYGFNSSVNSGEYTQTQLLNTLQNNSKYYIEFYISLADTARFATTHIGIYISDSAVGSSGSGQLHYTPQIISTTLSQVTNKNGWSKISGTYTAHGGEKFITIGNFNPNSYADTVFVGGGVLSWPVAYYYFDDVYVGLDTTVKIKEQNILDFNFKVYPNPTSDVLFLEYSLNSYQPVFFEIYNNIGELVYNKSFQTENKFQTIKCNLSSGLYYYKFSVDGKVYQVNKLIIIK